MNVVPELRLRTSVVLLQIGTLVVTLAVVGTALLAYVITEFSRSNILYAARASETMAHRVETFLDDLSSHIRLVGAHYMSQPDGDIKSFMEMARETHLSGMFLVDRNGVLKAASLPDGNTTRERELEGIDLSSYPLLKDVHALSHAIWSDKHISAITGNVTVGLAVPLNHGEAIIAEVPLSAIVDVGNIFREKSQLEYWIIDSKGEVVADTSGDETQIMNMSNLEIVRAGLMGGTQPESMTFRGREYHVSATYSPVLGWLFVGRVPAGFANQDLRELLYIVLAFALGITVFSLLLAPLWAQQIAKPVGTVAELAKQIAAGKHPHSWPHGQVRELNALLDHLKAMSDAIAKREEELRNLNEGLETRVEERTRELSRINSDLKNALTEVRQARDELIQSEKVAALGRMVAGISHELNTPLGNGRMAVSTLAARLERFRERLTEPPDTADLKKFLETVDLSVEIAESNLVRASNLVRSFKEISADRTASRRRKVILRELFDEVAISLTPMLKQSAVKLEVDVPGTIWIDSYPGELGQVIANIVENAIVHAFPERQPGTIALTAEQTSEEIVTIHLSDDGVGMTPEVALKAFDPFYTTAMGQGGTGLGLFIVHRTVESVLGGTVALKSKLGMGSAFRIQIPVTAPIVDAEEIGRAMKVG